MKKFKTRQEMANELGISYTTFYRKCKTHGIALGRGLLCPAQQQEIWQTLGVVDTSETAKGSWPEETRPNLKGFGRL